MLCAQQVWRDATVGGADEWMMLRADIVVAFVVVVRQRTSLNKYSCSASNWQEEASMKMLFDSCREV